MTGGYLVRIANRNSDPEPISVGLRQVFTRDGVTIWSDEPVVPLGDRGCVIGDLFPAARGSLPVAELDAAARAGVEQTGGRSLLADFWGGYVAVWVGADDRTRVLRDPSAALPCLYIASEAAIFIASDARQLLNVAAAPARVDYVELARSIVSPDSGGRGTCLHGVCELSAGECLLVYHGLAVPELWWTPWHSVGQTPPRSFADASAELRDVVLDCVGRWTSRRASLVLGVSGGLDSSIVAASSCRSTRDLRCLTMVGPDPDGDETAYARTLTQALSLPLTVRHYDVGAIDLARSVLSHLPRPMGAYFLQGIESAHHAQMRDRQVDAFFTGHGGDAVFCSIRSAAPLLDRLAAEGIGFGLIHTARDIADLTGASFATILRLAARKYARHRRARAAHSDPSGLSAKMVERLEPPTARHPWLTDIPRVPPGTREHVGMVLRSLRNVELYSRDVCAPQIAPLLSQPVIEKCLSVPSWMWIAGGIDRAVARHAFADLLPGALVERTAKGGPDGFMHALYRQRGGEIKALLRSGLLVTHGVLDPAFLDAPDDPSWRGKPVAQRMMAFGIAEAWARAWA